MKANELTYGDWVLINGVARKVCAITKRKVGYHLCDGESTMHYARLHDIIPIPLTPEILEKNGFEKHIETGPYFDYYHTYKGFTIFNSRVWHQCILDSVHKLQHALRLCGLDNLADTFKV